MQVVNEEEPGNLEAVEVYQPEEAAVEDALLAEEAQDLVGDMPENL